MPGSHKNTILLQAAAAVLIANSHLEGLYPKSWMAADGFLGNSMFFLLSGYGIALSLSSKHQSFPSFYWRRILRIYPIVWIVQVVFYFLLQGRWKGSVPEDYLSALIYPTDYGYVRQIMVFYAIFYFLKNWLNPRTLIALIGVLFVPLFWFFLLDFTRQDIGRLQLGNTHPWLWWVFFFQVMLFGGWLAVRGLGAPAFLPASAQMQPHAGRDAGAPRPKASSLFPSPISNLLCFLCCFAAYVALKFLMVFGAPVPLLHISLGRFYILLHLLMVPLLYFAFHAGTSEMLLARLDRLPAVRWLLALVGGLTLEIYTVHGFVFEDDHVRRLAFPVNVAVFFVITIALSAAIAASSKYVRRAFEIGLAKAACVRALIW